MIYLLCVCVDSTTLLYKVDSVNSWYTDFTKDDE